MSDVGQPTRPGRVRLMRVLLTMIVVAALAVPLTVAAQINANATVDAPVLVVREDTFDLSASIQSNAGDLHEMRITVQVPGGCSDEDEFGSYFSFVGISPGPEESLAPLAASFECNNGAFTGIWGPTLLPGNLPLSATFHLSAAATAPLGLYNVRVDVVRDGQSLANASTSFRVIVDLPDAIFIDPTTVSADPGSQVSLTATIIDEEEAPIEGLPVTFVVSGANSTSGTVISNGEGKATFSYTGSESGRDTVTAFVDYDGSGNPVDPMATATVIWNGEDEDPSLKPFFTALEPAPHSTSETGEVTIAAVATANSAIETFTLELNGVLLAPEIAGPDEQNLSAFTGVELTAGVYTATATVVDDDGREFQAQWDFVVSDDENETQWFTGDGAPKAENINATMTSLVEAFRWHLFGESWDGSDHPEMPTHVDTVTTADPLDDWVTGTTFDQEYTEATLRSLVEAFRWHFWGESWDNQARCDIPTHVDCEEFTGPTNIDPWFTESGDPIAENIDATLRSLVEAFRWHFWGYSWDGSHHFDGMPTHAEH